MFADRLAALAAALIELGQRLDAGERVEFAGEVLGALHKGLDRLMRQDAGQEDREWLLCQLAAICEAWEISWRLARSTEWRRQVEASEEGLRSGDLAALGEPLGIEDLRHHDD